LTGTPLVGVFLGGLWQGRRKLGWRKEPPLLGSSRQVWKPKWGLGTTFGKSCAAHTSRPAAEFRLHFKKNPRKTEWFP